MKRKHTTAELDEIPDQKRTNRLSPHAHSSEAASGTEVRAEHRPAVATYYAHKTEIACCESPLRIAGYVNNLSSPQSDDGNDSDFDSLFDTEDEKTVPTAAIPLKEVKEITLRHPARCVAPPIPGLFFDPSVEISDVLAKHLWESCMRMFFRNKEINQVMLFERAKSSEDKIAAAGTAFRTIADTRSVSGLPAFLMDLLESLRSLLKPKLPPETHDLLFPHAGENMQARQVILNHYLPGEGITPHVDLLKRYGDGIIGVSLHSGCVMQFAKVQPESSQPVASSILHCHSDSTTPTQNGTVVEGNGPIGPDPKQPTQQKEVRPGADKAMEHNIYLPARSVIVLTGEARYGWTHAIERLAEDLIEGNDGAPAESISRDERLSITYRWLLPGADVVGGSDIDTDTD